MIDVGLLRILKHRSEFLRLQNALPVAALDPQTIALARDFGKYFKQFSHDVIDIDLFIPKLKVWHKGITEEQLASYTAILRNIGIDVDPETKSGILSDLHELTLGTHIANACEQFISGDLEYPLVEVVTAKIDEYKIQMGMKATLWDDTPIDDLLQDDVDERGLKWRLDCLNASMRPLRPGDFGIVAARPDKGKTTFLASEVSHLAAQLPEDKNVIWLNNESTSGAIKKRLYQAALGLTIQEMVALSKTCKLQDAYNEVLGRRDKIRIVDIHGFHVGQVEAIIEASNAGLIIYDMIDNIRGFSSAARTDLQLEYMYQWARERCVKYSAVALATSQISSEGEGQEYPVMALLKDSRTGKQGACDFQLMIGAKNDTNYEYVRYLSLPKNKLRKFGAGGSLHKAVKYMPHIGRYEDIIEGDPSNIGVANLGSTVKDFNGDANV